MLLSFNLSGYAENTCEVWWDLRMTAVAFFYKNSFINLPIAVTNWNILKILLDFSHEKIGRGFWTLKKLLSIYLLSIHGQIYQPSLLVSKGDLDLWKCLRYCPSEQYSQNTKILIKILHITEMFNPIIACCCTLWNRTTTTWSHWGVTLYFMRLYIRL